jgi:hypothetical protein
MRGHEAEVLDIRRNELIAAVAAAPPISVMNSRRFIRSPRRRG